MKAYFRMISVFMTVSMVMGMSTFVYAEDDSTDDHGASKYNLTLNSDKSEEMGTEVYTSTDADDTSLYSYGDFNDAGEEEKHCRNTRNQLIGQLIDVGNCNDDKRGQ
jgi:hypothetical protein